MQAAADALGRMEAMFDGEVYAGHWSGTVLQIILDGEAVPGREELQRRWREEE